jgi:hypothetical protein
MKYTTLFSLNFLFYLFGGRGGIREREREREREIYRGGETVFVRSVVNVKALKAAVS